MHISQCCLVSEPAEPNNVSPEYRTSQVSEVSSHTSPGIFVEKPSARYQDEDFWSNRLALLEPSPVELLQPSLRWSCDVRRRHCDTVRMPAILMSWKKMPTHFV